MRILVVEPERRPEAREIDGSLESMQDIVMELVKHYAYARQRSNLTYYRDSNAKEIDLFVEQDQQIHPLEIKKSANPDRREVKKYELLDKAALERGCGGIVCMCEQVIPIDPKNCFIPCNLL